MASPSTGSAKDAALTAWFRARGSVLIGFSGGVDSAFLAAVAVEALGPARVLAVIGRSASYPAVQWERARAVARQLAVPVLEVDTDELADPRYAANPTNRCYFCKTELWSRLVPVARARGLAVVVDGTNADDLTDHRPGGRAAREHGVVSPLAELAWTKAEIRAASQARGLPTWDLPSSPCLASRLPYGTEVTPLRLRTVETAEAALRALGVDGNLRVRHLGRGARVELDPVPLARWGAGTEAARATAAVRAAGFERVEFAPFRSGALNVLAGLTDAAGRVGAAVEGA